MATAALSEPRPRSVPWPGALTGVAGLATAAAALAVLAFLIGGVRSGPVDWLRLLTSPVWDPVRADFGAAAMVWGTGAVCAIALLVAVPLGWAAAIGLTELLPVSAARIFRTGVELLAAIPSIVYGLVGITVLRPVVSTVFGTPGGDGLLTAGLVLAVMVLPTLVAVSVDALTGVPPHTREAAAALGLTRTEVIYSAVLPEAGPGMRAAVLLALARALGETIAVFLVIGRADGRLPAPADALAALVSPGQTLTTKLGGPEPVLAEAMGAHRAALSALGLLLFVLVAVITVAGFHRSTRTSKHHRLRTRPRWRQPGTALPCSSCGWRCSCRWCWWPTCSACSRYGERWGGIQGSGGSLPPTRAAEEFVTRSSARWCSCWAPRSWPLPSDWDSAC